MPVHLDDIVTGLQMLGGVLSTPRRVEAQQQQAEIERQLLQGSGLSQADIEAATPQPALRWLSPQQGGFTGKILGGVGDVGSLISSVVGRPIAAPRATISELAEASKLRTAHAKDIAEKNLATILQDPKSTPQDISAAAVAAGNMDAALRYRGRMDMPARPPGSAFAARQRLATLDPNSDEARQLRQGLAEDEAARQKTADEANRRFEERFKKEHPFADVSPEEQQHRKWAQLQADRDKEADRLGLTGDAREFYKQHGYQQPPAKPQRGMTMKDIMAEASRQAAHEAPPGMAPDPDEIRRRGYALANAYTKQGIPIEGFDPTIQPPEAPPPKPKPEAPPEKTWGQWLFGGGDTSPTPTPTTPPTSTTSTTIPAPSPTAANTGDLPPEVMSILDQVPLTSRDQVDQVQALHDAFTKGTPIETLKNWATYIARPPQPQAAPR
jgi:hypothetical protein